MPNPVQNRGRVAPPQPPQQRVNEPAPGGVGDAPDAVQSAQGQEYKPGWIETGIAKIREWVIWALKKVLPCFFPAPPPPAPPPPLPDPPPAIQPPRIVREIRAEVAYLETLDRLTDRQKDRIYRKIGKDMCKGKGMCKGWVFWFKNSCRSYEEIGRRALKENPLILGRYLRLNRQPAENDV